MRQTRAYMWGFALSEKVLKLAVCQAQEVIHDGPQELHIKWSLSGKSPMQ